MHHLIKTQILEVTTDNATEAFELQHKLNSLFYRVLLPLIEKTFDQLSPSNRIVYLDSLSIDLGTMTVEALDRRNWTIEFTELLSRQLKEAMLTQSLNYKTENTFASIAKQWLFYMQYGYLPWNTTDTNKDWYDKVLEELATDYGSIELLRRLILSDERALRRISLLDMPAFLVHLTEVLTGKNQSDLARYLDVLEKILIKPGTINTIGSRAEFITAVWIQIFRYCASVAADANDLMENAVLATLEKKQLKELIEEAEQEALLSPFLPFIKKSYADASAGKEKHTQLAAEVKQPERRSRSAISDEGLFVKHAGLVLLHPFLTSFFKILQLSNNEMFNSKVAQLKALSLLHFLATGSMQIEEHELVIPKILTGYPLEEPVEKQKLSAMETEEAEQLLKAVIEQWSILKNTSVDALRQSFLQRSGKLITASDENYRLLVETDSLDVLLDHLPWGFSMVKLPWMKQLLKVEWR
jgi:hypothetical protein